MISSPHLAFSSLKRKPTEQYISWTVFMMEKDAFYNEISGEMGALS